MILRDAIHLNQIFKTQAENGLSIIENGSVSVIYPRAEGKSVNVTCDSPRDVAAVLRAVTEDVGPMGCDPGDLPSIFFEAVDEMEPEDLETPLLPCALLKVSFPNQALPSQWRIESQGTTPSERIQSILSGRDTVHIKTLQGPSFDNVVHFFEAHEKWDALDWRMLANSEGPAN